MSDGPTRERVDERRLLAPLPDAFDQPYALPEQVGPLDAATAPARDPFAPRRAEEARSGHWLTARGWPPRQSPRQWVMRARAATILEQERGVLFLCLPPLLALGVFLYLALPEEPSLVAVWVACAVLGALVAVARGRPLLRLALAALLVVTLGTGFAGLETWRAGTKMLGGEITTRLTGRVVQIDRLASGRTRMTLDVIATERPVLRYAPDRVRVSAATVPGGLQAGSTVKGVARLLPPSGPLRPGSYDFSFESYFDRIGANGFFFRPPELLVAADSMPARKRIAAAIDNFRNRVASRIRAAIGGAEGEIAAALIVGVRAGIPEPVNEALRRTGLAHILSISGLHMALVAASIMGGMRLVFGFFSTFSSRHAVKKFAAAVALLAVAAYLLVSGAEVAAQRSFIMLAVMLIAVLFDRAALTMRNLAIAALVVIALSPHEVVGPSFQMSFAATAALIGGYAAWSRWRRGKRNAYQHQSVGRLIASKAVTLTVGIAATALIAGLATSIYGAWHFQRVSPLSLIANLTVTPITAAVMWAAVFASAAMPFGLDGPFLALIGWLLSLMLKIADWFSARTPFDAVGAISGNAVVLLTLALLIATLATSWLRALALPFLVAGFFALLDRPRPDLLISEDGRLVAVRIEDGDLAINRSRPNRFTIDDWQRATGAAAVIRPQAKGEQSAFRCADGVCALDHPDGSRIVVLERGESLADHCVSASVIVVEDATSLGLCRTGGALVITARDVAQRGSAWVALDMVESEHVAVEYAIDRPYRPWHMQRQFSRAARGMVPFRPQPRRAAP